MLYFKLIFTRQEIKKKRKEKAKRKEKKNAFNDTVSILKVKLVNM